KYESEPHLVLVLRAQPGTRTRTRIGVPGRGCSIRPSVRQAGCSVSRTVIRPPTTHSSRSTSTSRKYEREPHLVSYSYSGRSPVLVLVLESAFLAGDASYDQAFA